MHDQDGSTDTRGERRSGSGRGVGRMLRWLPLLLVAGAFLVGPALAQAGTEPDDGGEPAADESTDAATAADDALLAQGAEVYQAVCSSCHQPGGVGLSGQYPPLIGNPNVQDTAYVEDVIRNGRQGPITVDGVAYDGVMPAQSTVSDDDIEAVIAYIQSGFAAPSTAAQPEVATGPTAGTTLPDFSDWAIAAALVVGLGAGALVLAPRIVGAHDRRTMPWLDAWLKTGVIVIGMIVVTTLVPARVLEFEAVRDLPRAMQDVIALSLWLGGLGGGLWALWYAHRESRI